ncbi:MAG TPA: hypothetical protein VJO35_03460 [Terriglobales bacterium]|nr:hypothetical protein [Terriglobales bacterium]
MLLRLAITTVLLSVSAFSQTRMGGFGPGNLNRFGVRPVRTAHPHHRSYSGYYGLPYFYSDYEPSEEYVPEPEPPPAPAPVMHVKTEPVPDPELLELHDGQWVRVTNFTQIDSASRLKVPSEVAPKPLPPAVLVFRDGHSEEISSYSIIGQVIYTKADYWSTGKWIRSIAIGGIDIPATLKQNKDRGVKFELPSSPDEVMIRQ